MRPIIQTRAMPSGDALAAALQAWLNADHFMTPASFERLMKDIYERRAT
jgi:hypothetical protein